MSATQSSRDYWDRRPCNVRHSREPADTERYSREVTARKYLAEPHIPGFLEPWRWHGRRVLDVGCGIGTLSLDLARHGAEVTAVDFSTRSLDVAVCRSHAEGLSVDWVHADACRAGLPMGPFDLVVAFGTLHHMERPEDALENAVMRLRPGGVAKVMVYNRWSTHALALLWGNGTEAEPGCPLVRYYSYLGLATMMRRCGLRVDRVWADHHFRFDRAAWGRGEAVEKPVLAPRFLGWHLMGEGHV